MITITLTLKNGKPSLVIRSTFMTCLIWPWRIRPAMTANVSSFIINTSRTIKKQALARERFYLYLAFMAMNVWGLMLSFMAINISKDNTSSIFQWPIRQVS